jgi:hypothetical protein
MYRIVAITTRPGYRRMYGEENESVPEASVLMKYLP